MINVKNIYFTSKKSRGGVDCYKMKDEHNVCGYSRELGLVAIIKVLFLKFDFKCDNTQSYHRHLYHKLLSIIRQIFLAVALFLT